MTDQTVLDRLFAVIQERKKSDPPESYTASLYRKGEDAILKKIGEEAWEVLLASKSGNSEEIVHESADLLFHLLVLLGFHDIPLDRIYTELKHRAQTSEPR